MSGILECKGVFQVPVPDGWAVSGEPGRTYDLSHASEDVGVNISVYAQQQVGPDIQAAVRSFAESVGVDASGVRVVLAKDDKAQRRAFARFDIEERTWLVAFLYVGEFAVLATSNSAVGDGLAFSLGEQIVASLGPVEKRGLFKRR